MGDWQDGYFSGTKAGGNLALKPNVDYELDGGPGHDGVYDWLSDSFTLPKGAPHRPPAIKWLALPRQQEGAGHVQPGEGLDPGPAGREHEAVRALPEVGAQAVEDGQARRLADARRRRRQRWNTDVDTALGLFVQTKDVAKLPEPRSCAARRLEERTVKRASRSAGEEHTEVGTRVAPGLPLHRPDRRLRLRPDRLEHQGVAQRLADVASQRAGYVRASGRTGT